MINFIFLLSVFLTSLLFAQGKKCDDSYQGLLVAKKGKFIEKRFGTKLKDEYKWMEDSLDSDLIPWIEAQKKHLEKSLNQNTKNELIKSIDKMRKFTKEANKSVVKSRKSKEKIVEPTAPYRIEVEDIKQFGTGYGGLPRVKILDKENKTVDIFISQYFKFLKWVDDETFIYGTTPSYRVGGSNRAEIKMHKVGDHPADDKLIYRGGKAEWLEILESNGEFYASQWDFRTRNQKIVKINIETGDIEVIKELGELRQLVGFAPENQQLHMYLIDYTQNNYGVFQKANMETGEISNLLKEQDFIITNAHLVSKERYLVLGSRDAESVAGFVEDGNYTELDLPKSGYIELSSFDRSSNKLTLKYQSLKSTVKLLEVNLNSYEVNLVKTIESPIKTVVQKVHYTAVNGQKAAIWVVRKEGVELTESTPMIMYGYGGWYHLDPPRFNVKDHMAWLEMGGAFSIAAVPGSLEYGMSWNQMAKVGGRANSFDSFANAGRELIKRGFTSSKHLGIMGGSNGGLLVAGAMQRHPNLFAAAVPMVAVVDLLNFKYDSLHWEYGNPYNKEDFEELLKISPYQNIKKQNYPAILLTAGDMDQVVRPAQIYKYAARLQRKSTGENPTFLYTKKFGAHSDTSGSKKDQLDYMATIYAFFAKYLKLN